MTNLTRVKGTMAISFNKALEFLSGFNSLQQARGLFIGCAMTYQGPMIMNYPPCFFVWFPFLSVLKAAHRSKHGFCAVKGNKRSGDQGQSKAQGPGERAKEKWIFYPEELAHVVNPGWLKKAEQVPFWKGCPLYSIVNFAMPGKGTRKTQGSTTSNLHLNPSTPGSSFRGLNVLDDSKVNKSSRTPVPSHHFQGP